MPQSLSSSIYSADPLIPLYMHGDDLDTTVPVNLAPSTVYARGTVLGQITSSADDVQRLTITGTPDGGTFKMSGVNPVTGASFTTANIAYNATAAQMATAIQTAIGSGVTVTGSGTGPFDMTFGGTAAKGPVQAMTLGANGFTGGTAPTLAVTHTTVGRSAGAFNTYADANVDGTGVARCILKYACATDAAGLIYYGSQASSDVFAIGARSAPAYITGIFSTKELVGLDDAAVADLNGALVSGTAADGVLKF